MLAQLLAAAFLPAVWLPDEATFALRRQLARRAHIVRQRTRLKNQVQSILHRNLVGRCPAADLFGNKGRAWLAAQDLPQVRRLLTIPGVDATVALAIVAAVGDFQFSCPQRLVSYLGLNPRVRQSGGQPASTAGSPSKAAPTPAGCWWRQPGRRPRPRGRCAPSTSISGPGAACGSPW